jgi:GMP synthase-like glutamine amidotransferase
MNKHALIITNIFREQPGTISDVLQKRGWHATIVNADQGESIPSHTNFDALFVMGGPPSANDSPEITTWMPDEVEKIREALDAGIPYYGVCLGLQTLVKAAGGRSIPSLRKEVGFRDSYAKPLGKIYTIQLTEDGKNDPLLKDLPHSLQVFHLHGETVELPNSMKFTSTLLATADVVPTQFLRIGKNAYGSQGHFQVTPELLQAWLKVDPDLLELGPKGVEQCWKDYQDMQVNYLETANKFFNNFLDIAESRNG